MLQLRIKTTPIRLSYNIQDGQLKQQTTLPRVEIKTTQPQLKIINPNGELKIDNTPFRYSIGKKPFADFTRDNVELSRQIYQDNLVKIVQKGRELAKIYDKSKTIGKIETQFSQEKLLDITWAPLAAPEIRYQAYPAEIEVIPGKVEITPHFGRVDNEFIPGSVDIRVTQYPKVEFSVVDIKV